MQTNADEQSLKIQEALRSVQQLDLGAIRSKLTGPAEMGGKGWKEERYKRAEEWYRRMLAIAMVFGPAVTPIHQDVDEVWHAHILSTQDYQRDCHRLFGHYLHHVPCGPSTPEGTLAAMRNNTQQTLALYHRFFGSDPRFLSLATDSSRCDSCGGEGNWKGTYDSGDSQWEQETGCDR